MMNIRRILAGTVLVAALLITTGCLTIEQEVYLNQDGSGEAVLSMALPDLPSDALNNQAAPMPNMDSAAILEGLKSAVSANLPPTVKLKTTNLYRKNGSVAWYAIFEFENLKDMGAVLTNLGKSTQPPSGQKGESSPADSFNGELGCDFDLHKTGAKSVYTGRISYETPKPPENTDAKPPESQKAEERKQPDDKLGDLSIQPKPGADEKAQEPALDLSKQIAPLVMGAFRLRFILHAPRPITDTNADLVLRGNTAVWNCTLLGFLKDKKSIDGGRQPIELRATF